MQGSSRMVRHAMLMMAGTLVSRVLGLAREVLVAVFFGATRSLDAFNVAYTLANLARQLVAEGALSAAFVPVFSQALQESRERALSLGRQAMTVLIAASGLVTLAVPERIYPVLAAKLTEAMVVPIPDEGTGYFGGIQALEAALALAQNMDAVLVGPGLGRKPETSEFVRLFAADVKAPLVMDADAIAAFIGHLDALRDLPQVPILTPHLGEFSALLGVETEEASEDLLRMARDAARDHQAVFVVKGACTIVVYPDGDAFFTTCGNAGMATAGAGDVLAGTVVGLMRQMESGMTPIVGVWLHGYAGDRAYEKRGNGLIAGDILKRLPRARRELDAAAR